MFIRHQFQWKTENMSKKRCLQHQIGMPSVWCWFKPAGTNRWVIRELLNSPSQQNNRRGLAISIHHVKILTVLIANDMQLQNHFCLMYFTHIERLTSWTNHHQPVCNKKQLVFGSFSPPPVGTGRALRVGIARSWLVTNSRRILGNVVICD